MKTEQITTIVESEELLILDDGTSWDAIIAVDVEIQEADESVGFNGGGYENGYSITEYMQYDAVGEKLIGGVDTLKSLDLFDKITQAIADYISKHEDEIIEQAIEEQADAYEAARDAYYEAKMEEQRGN